MMANAGIKYKKKHHTKLVLYCLDLWPESLCTGGIRKESFVYKHFHKVSEKIYRQADKILISSKSFADYFEKEFGIRNAVYLPQYAETVFTPEQCRKEPNEYLDLMFAGNLGKAQSVVTIIEAARLTQNIPNLRWHIVGDGSEFENLKKQAAGLNNIIFYGRKPLDEMPKYYSMADAMLVTMQRDPIVSLTLPGKVQTYMAAGKPIIGAIDGETATIIEESACGFCGPAEDVNVLIKNVLLFFNLNNMENIFGRRAREYYEQFYNRRTFVNSFEEELQECVDMR